MSAGFDLPLEGNGFMLEEEDGAGDQDEAAASLTADYDSFAYYYDLEYQRVTADLDFYHEMARRAGARGQILELACGSGRISLPLLRAGFKVTGLDLSAKMLELARARAAAEPA